MKQSTHQRTLRSSSPTASFLPKESRSCLSISVDPLRAQDRHLRPVLRADKFLGMATVTSLLLWSLWSMVFSERLLPEYSAVANRACLCSPPSFSSWYEQVAQQFPPRHSKHLSKSFTPVRLVLSERQLQICLHKNRRQLRGTQQFCDEFISGKKRHFPRHVVILKFVKARVSREHCARPSQPEPSRSYQNDCL